MEMMGMGTQMYQWRVVRCEFSMVKRQRCRKHAVVTRVNALTRMDDVVQRCGDGRTDPDHKDGDASKWLSKESKIRQEDSISTITDRNLENIIDYDTNSINRKFSVLKSSIHKAEGNTNRRGMILRSSASMLMIGSMGFFEQSEFLDTDGRTVVNSILGAYGLPKMAPSSGFKTFDDVEEGLYFEYPKSWVKKRNHLRPGVYISNFDTADKITLEAFPLFSSKNQSSAEISAEDLSLTGSLSDLDALYVSDSFVSRLLSALLLPGAEVGGDSRLELPPLSKVKKQVTTDPLTGKKMMYFSFPSEVTTRSGYQIKRRNVAVAAVHKAQVYVLGASARKDQWNKEKSDLFDKVIESFHLYD